MSGYNTTRQEAENTCSNFVLREKSEVGVGKIVGQIGCDGLKNLIIFVHFVADVVLPLSLACGLVHQVEC